MSEHFCDHQITYDEKLRDYVCSKCEEVRSYRKPKIVCSCNLTNWDFIDQDDLDGTFFIKVHARDEGHKVTLVD